MPHPHPHPAGGEKREIRKCEQMESLLGSGKNKGERQSRDGEKEKSCETQRSSVRFSSRP